MKEESTSMPELADKSKPYKMYSIAQLGLYTSYCMSFMATPWAVSLSMKVIKWITLWCQRTTPGYYSVASRYCTFEVVWYHDTNHRSMYCHLVQSKTQKSKYNAVRQVSGKGHITATCGWHFLLPVYTSHIISGLLTSNNDNNSHPLTWPTLLICTAWKANFAWP